MPPHARMSLAQQLLLLIYFMVLGEHRTVRSLFDGEHACTTVSCCHSLFTMTSKMFYKFLTRPVIRFPWISFDPHFEFRFPIYGKVTYQGMEIELRQALEPWHVLGRGARWWRHGTLCGFIC